MASRIQGWVERLRKPLQELQGLGRKHALNVRWLEWAQSRHVVTDASDPKGALESRFLFSKSILLPPLGDWVDAKVRPGAPRESEEQVRSVLQQVSELVHGWNENDDLINELSPALERGELPLPGTVEGFHCIAEIAYRLIRRESLEERVGASVLKMLALSDEALCNPQMFLAPLPEDAINLLWKVGNAELQRLAKGSRPSRVEDRLWIMLLDHFDEKPSPKFARALTERMAVPNTPVSDSEQMPPQDWLDYYQATIGKLSDWQSVRLAESFRVASEPTEGPWSDEARWRALRVIEGVCSGLLRTSEVETREVSREVHRLSSTLSSICNSLGLSARGTVWSRVHEVLSPPYEPFRLGGLL